MDMCVSFSFLIVTGRGWGNGPLCGGLVKCRALLRPMDELCTKDINGDDHLIGDRPFDWRSRLDFLLQLWPVNQGDSQGGVFCVLGPGPTLDQRIDVRVDKLVPKGQRDSLSGVTEGTEKVSMAVQTTLNCLIFVY